jgi:hypothetical protein
LSDEQIAAVQAEVEKLTEADTSQFTEGQNLLYSFLRRGIEYVLAPAVVGRISTIESSLPSLGPIAKVANPPELTAPPATFWICTAVTATPIGNRYEVTREYTLNFSGWEDVGTLYAWEDNNYGPG